MLPNWVLFHTFLLETSIWIHMRKSRVDELTYKRKLQELYGMMADRVEITLGYLRDAVLAICHNDPAALDQSAKQISAAESESDRIHDEVIRRMHSSETLVFSRQDRLQLIALTDNIIDSADSAVRRLTSYFPRPAPELTALFEQLAVIIVQIGKATKNMLANLFKDFAETKNNIKEIEELRRLGREIEFNFLRKLFALNPPSPDLLYFDRSIRKLTKIIATAKYLASNIHSLILKYEL
jgi:uncharacterized protein Yka (UPF0111/DUF47 family)